MIPLPNLDLTNYPGPENAAVVEIIFFFFFFNIFYFLAHTTPCDQPEPDAVTKAAFLPSHRRSTPWSRGPRAAWHEDRQRPRSPGTPVPPGSASSEDAVSLQAAQGCSQAPRGHRPLCPTMGTKPEPNRRGATRGMVRAGELAGAGREAQIQARLDLGSSSPIWFPLNQPHKVERVSSPHAAVCKEGEVKQLF